MIQFCENLELQLLDWAFCEKLLVLELFFATKRCKALCVPNFLLNVLFYIPIVFKYIQVKMITGLGKELHAENISSSPLPLLDGSHKPDLTILRIPCN